MTKSLGVLLGRSPKDALCFKRTRKIRELPQLQDAAARQPGQNPTSCSNSCQSHRKLTTTSIWTSQKSSDPEPSVSYGLKGVARPSLLLSSSKNRIWWLLPFSQSSAQIRRIFLDGYGVLVVKTTDS
ncbi:hypothetical protein Tco_0642985 [Tanacetum coccineum]